ncbi:MAG: VOC family protein [Acidimicrobiales bacterium]
MSVNLFAVSLDCADAGKLADFWSQVLERPIDDGASEDFAAIGTSATATAGPAWMFHRVAEPKQVKNRVHADLTTPALPGEVERILSLGGRHVRDVDEGGYQWATLADPEGNEFDVVAVPA